jgi:hypothetical protein
VAPNLSVLPDNRRVMNSGESWKSSLTEGEAKNRSAETRGGAVCDTHEWPFRYMYWRRLGL